MVGLNKLRTCPVVGSKLDEFYKEGSTLSPDSNRSQIPDRNKNKNKNEVRC